MRINWTEEEIDYTFKCLMEGMSASAVAKDMTEKGMRSDCAPLTRNAIIGIWNRNNERKLECLKLRDPIKKKIKKTKSSVTVKKDKEEIVPAEGVMFIDLKSNMCRFIFGDPREEDMRYCGQKIDIGKSRSFCKLHHALCYRPAGRL